MGVLASHVPSIEQLKPGLVEVIEESGGKSKQFFRTSNYGSVSSWIDFDLSSLHKFCRASRSERDQNLLIDTA